MGLDAIALRLLVMNRDRDARLGRTVTLGRQGIHISEEFVRVVAGISGPYRHENFYRHEFYCENLLVNHFGADLVDSIDYSDFEGATIVHDLNTELPQEYQSKYDTVIDLGTSEHVFDVAQCLRNAALLVRDSGTILHVLPASNFCGHGFWQFSPEVFFSFYSQERGYKDTEVYIANADGFGEMTKIEPPRDGKRAEIRSEARLSIIVRTIKDQALASRADVHQSDYVHLWTEFGDEQVGNRQSASSPTPTAQGLVDTPEASKYAPEATIDVVAPPNVTIVSAFFSIGRGEWANHSRSDDTYFDWFVNLLRLRNDLIVFTSPDLVKRVSDVAAQNRSSGGLQVVPVPDFRDGMLELRDAMASCMSNPAFQRFSQHRVVTDPKMNPTSMADYFVINLKKTRFLEWATQEYDVNTPYVAWIDFGFIRESSRVPAGGAWSVDFDLRRIHKFTLRPLPDSVPVFDIARRGDRFVVGNAMVGPADPEIWHELSELRETIMWSLVNCGIVDDDQTVMLASIRERPDLFEVHPINDWHDAMLHYNIQSSVS